MERSEDFGRSPEHFRGFPKIPRTLPKIFEGHPNNSKDFQNITRTLPKISEYYPNNYEDFQRSLDYFRQRSPEHFPGFPKTCDNLRRFPKVTAYFLSFPKFWKIEVPVCFFFRDSYCSFPCKAVSSHKASAQEI